MTATEMESSTQVLRRLLDERGVEWGNVRNDGSESDYLTEWQFDGIEGHAIATEWSIGHLTVCIAHPMTPEQAIDATLGRGTCRVGRGTSGLMHVTTGHCSECGAEVVKPARYCPNCGRRVVK